MGHEFDTDGVVSLRDGSGQDAGDTPLALSASQDDWDGFTAWRGTKAAARSILRHLGQLLQREHSSQTVGGNGFDYPNEVKVEISGGNLVISRPFDNLVAILGGTPIEYVSNSLSTALPSVSAGSVRYAQLSVNDLGVWQVSFGTSYARHLIPVARLYYDGTSWHLSDEVEYPGNPIMAHELRTALDQLQIVTSGQQSVNIDSDLDNSLEALTIFDYLGFMNGSIQRTVIDGANAWDYKQYISTLPHTVPVYARLTDGGGGYTWQNQGVQTNGIPFMVGSSPLPQYNQSGQVLTEVTDGQFVCYFLFLTNNPQYPVISIPATKQQTTLKSAREYELNEFMGDLGNLGDHPFSRMAPICKVIIQGDSTLTNSYKALYREIIDLRYYKMGNWAYMPKHEALEGRMDDDAHPQLALARFQFTTYTTAGPHDVSAEDERMFHVAFNPAVDVVLDLPPLSAFAGKSGYTAFMFNAAQSLLVNTGAVADKVLLPGGVSKDSIATTGYGSYLGLIALPANGVWLVIDGNGKWSDLLTSPTYEYNWDGNIPSGVEGNVVSIDAYGNPKDSDVAVESVERRWTEFSATRISNSTFTVEPTVEMLEKMRPGIPIKTDSTSLPNMVYYHVIQDVGLSGTKLLVTVSGFEVSGAVDKWWFGTATMTEQRVISIPGNFNDASDAALIEHDLSTFMRWGEDDAYLVGVEARCVTPDSIGAPTIQVSGGGLSLNNPLSVGSSWAYAPAGSWGQKLAFNDVIEIGVTKTGGSAGDAQDLTVVLTFVKDKNDRSDFEPASDPSILMIISGMSGYTTWCGLSDGAHILVPTTYSLTGVPTTGTPTAATITERWVFEPSTSVQKLSFYAKAKGPVTYSSVYYPTSAYSKVLLNNNGASPSYSFNNQYSYPGDPGTWGGRIHGRLMGSTTFAGFPGALFTWSRLGKHWSAL